MNRGSEWRKWDLHIHTPETAKNNQFGDPQIAWPKYIQTLEKSDISVFGITDYFSITNYLKVKDFKSKGRLENKEILPNVEMRIAPVTGNGKPINIHAIFDPTLTEDELNREFFREIKFEYKERTYSCIKEDLIELGRVIKDDKNLQIEAAIKEAIAAFAVSYEALRKIVNKSFFKNRIIIALSNSSNDGISGLLKQEVGLRPIKNEICRMADIILSGNPKDIEYFLGKKTSPEEVIENCGNLKPCITGSDAHTLDKIGIFPENRFTWIKADPTFEGLKQILFEPEERVRISDSQPDDKYDYNVIERVELNTAGVWHQTIYLNQNLNTIIGGRSTGKSTLLSSIAIKFDETISVENDSFIRQLGDNVHVYWRDGQENKLSRAERMQFFAYVQYLIHHRNKIDSLNEWMRVIHNLTHPDNTIADGNDDLARGIKSIEKLIPHAPNIIQYLREASSIDGFSKHQSSEECIKAHLVEKPAWRELIEGAEKHHYFNGQIGFLLEFSGICEYYHTNKHLDWSNSENKTFKNAFIRYSKIGKFVFDLNEKGVRFNDKDFCFERAVLAHGDYLLEGNTDYWNLLSTETVAKNVKRDLSWKRMLRMGDDKVMQKGKKLVKATFDDIADLNDIIGSLERLCIPQTEEEWRNTLISSPKMFKVCEKGFIYISKEEILLLGKWYLNHYHSELFTYHLWVEKFKDEDIFFEGFCKEYAWQKRSDISPHISIKDFSYKHNKYSIEIYTVLNANHDFDKFQLTFGFNNENKFDYPDEIIEILKELGIENEDETVNWFSWYCKSENSILSKTKYLADALFQLKQKK